MTLKTVERIDVLWLKDRSIRRAFEVEHTTQEWNGDHSRLLDGKSFMGILRLAAARGTTITISAEGQDEAAAVDALCRLVEAGFGEESWSS